MKVAVCGTVRNASKHLRKDILKLRRILKSADTVEFFLVESDSYDRTKIILGELGKESTDFHFTSLGNISFELPNRFERLAHARNKYIELMKKLGSRADLVVVCDFPFAPMSVVESDIYDLRFSEDSDVLTASSHPRYYDILALRAEDWNTEDYRVCLSRLASGAQGAKRLGEILRTCLLDKQRSMVGEVASLIQVRSSFGGFAIYKREFFDQGAYLSQIVEGFSICEHVPFHEMITRAGGRIAISGDILVKAPRSHIWYSGKISSKFLTHVLNLVPLRWAKPFLLLRLGSHSNNNVGAVPGWLGRHR